MHADRGHATEEAAIARFYFHLWKQRELIADDEGSELANIEAAYLQAFESAQELWAMLLARREDPTVYSFEVVDGEGQLMFVLPLAEVLETAQKRPPTRKREGLETASELIARTMALRQSLVDQIEAAHRTIRQTGEILAALRERRE